MIPRAGEVERDTETPAEGFVASLTFFAAVFLRTVAAALIVTAAASRRRILGAVLTIVLRLSLLAGVASISARRTARGGGRRKVDGNVGDVAEKDADGSPPEVDGEEEWDIVFSAGGMPTLRWNIAAPRPGLRGGLEKGPIPSCGPSGREGADSSSRAGYASRSDGGGVSEEEKWTAPAAPACATVEVGVAVLHVGSVGMSLLPFVCASKDQMASTTREGSSKRRALLGLSLFDVELSLSVAVHSSWSSASNDLNTEPGGSWTAEEAVGGKAVAASGGSLVGSCDVENMEARLSLRVASIRMALLSPSHVRTFLSVLWRCTFRKRQGAEMPCGGAEGSEIAPSCGIDERRAVDGGGSIIARGTMEALSSVIPSAEIVGLDVRATMCPSGSSDQSGTSALLPPGSHADDESYSRDLGARVRLKRLAVLLPLHHPGVCGDADERDVSDVAGAAARTLAHDSASASEVVLDMRGLLIEFSAGKQTEGADEEYSTNVVCSCDASCRSGDRALLPSQGGRPTLSLTAGRFDVTLNASKSAPFPPSMVESLVVCFGSPLPGGTNDDPLGVAAASVPTPAVLAATASVAQISSLLDAAATILPLAGALFDAWRSSSLRSGAVMEGTKEVEGGAGTRRVSAVSLLEVVGAAKVCICIVDDADAKRPSRNGRLSADEDCHSAVSLRSLEVRPTFRAGAILSARWRREDIAATTSAEKETFAWKKSKSRAEGDATWFSIRDLFLNCQERDEGKSSSRKMIPGDDLIWLDEATVATIATEDRSVSVDLGSLVVVVDPDRMLLLLAMYRVIGGAYNTLSQGREKKKRRTQVSLPCIEVSCRSLEARMEAEASGNSSEGDGDGGGCDGDRTIEFRALSKSLSAVIVPALSFHAEDYHLNDEKRERVSARADHLSVSVTFSPHTTLPTLDLPLGCGNEHNAVMNQRAISRHRVELGLTLSKANFSVPAIASKLGYEQRRDVNISTERLVFYEVADMGRTEVLRSSLAVSVGTRAVDNAFPPSEDVEKVYTPSERIFVLRTIKIQTHGPFAEVIWSTILHWMIVSCVRRCLDAVEHLQTSWVGQRKRMDKPKQRVKETTNIHVHTNSTMLHIRAFTGRSSVVEVRTQSLDINVNHDGIGMREKPDVAFQAGPTSVYIDGNESEVARVESMEFFDTFRRSTQDELQSYKDINTDSTLEEDIVCDRSNHPLTEVIRASLGSLLVVQIPPELQVGKVIEDINITPRILIDALRLSGLSKPRLRGKKKHQLMTIFAKVPFCELSFLGAPAEGSGTPKNDILRVCIDSMSLHVRRLTPSATVQQIINELDEDKSRHHNYGPRIHGGEIIFAFEHIVCILHPLTIVTPLCALRGVKMDGTLLLAGLDPESGGVFPPRTICVSLGCHHHACLPSQPRTRKVENTSCALRYGALLPSKGIPPKLYLDVRASVRRFDVTHGMAVQQATPLLLGIMRRLSPPPAQYISPVPISPALGWWDNLRFWVHGRFELKVSMLGFRFLLCSPERYNLSVFVKLNDCTLNHKFGDMRLSFSDMVVSVPVLSYHLVLGHDELNNNLGEMYDVENRCDQHTLLLVPNANFELSYDWSVDHPSTKGCADHHCAYVVPHHGIGKKAVLPKDDTSNEDRFQLFRSHGTKLRLKVSLAPSTEFSNWIALRVDVLPWLTHQLLSSALPTPRSNESDRTTGPVPPVDDVDILTTVQDLQVGIWFGTCDEYKCNSHVPQDARDGICLKVQHFEFVSKSGVGQNFRANGPIRACMLDVGCGVLDVGGNDYSADAGFLLDEHMAIFDGLSGSFGTSVGDGVSPSGARATNKESQKGIANLDSVNISTRNSHLLFEKLQGWSGRITETSFLLTFSCVDVMDRSLDAICTSQMVGASEGGGGNGPWTILISGMKLLWTLQLRDALLPIIQDLVFISKITARNFRQMGKSPDHCNVEAKSELRGMPPGNSRTSPDDTESNGSCERTNSVIGTTSKEVTRAQERCSSSLVFLLEKASSGDQIFCSENIRGHKPEIFMERRDLEARRKGMNSSHDDGGGKEFHSCSNVPIIDVHLSNPQIQLHSEATGGSVILAMRGAYIEGKSSLSLFADHDSPPDHAIDWKSLLRKTEFLYTLDKMEIYAVTSGVDVTAGLQWLETVQGENQPSGVEHAQSSAETSTVGDTPITGFCSAASTLNPDKVRKKERIMSARQFPTFLQRHQISDGYCRSCLLKKIMSPCTFQSTQICFRSPIDLTKRELKEFAKSGHVLSLSRNEKGSAHVPSKEPQSSARDQCYIHVDELSFDLDSFEFHTTIDLIRNVILVPPKPPRRTKCEAFHDEVEAKQETEPKDEIALQERRVENILHRLHSTARIKKGKKERDFLRSAVKELSAGLEDQHAMLGEKSIRCIQYKLGKAKWKVQSPEFIDDVQIEITGFHGQHNFSADGSIVSQMGLEDICALTSKPGPSSIGFEDPTIILKTNPEGDSSCVRCGKVFHRSANCSESCLFHPGTFSAQQEGDAIWSCCGSRGSDGCCSLPHSAKEKAAVVRVEALPSRIQGLTLYKHVEVNIYPNMRHKLEVQVTKELAGLFLEYFLGEDSGVPVDGADEYEIETVRSVKTTESREDANISRCTDSNVSQKKSLAPPKKKILLGNHVKCDVFEDSTGYNEDSMNPSLVYESTKKDPIPTAVKQKNEVIFIKFWRMGHVNSSISLAGFPVVMTDLGIDVPSFTRAYKVGTPNYLGHKYLSHLIQEVAKSATSSGFEKVREKMLWIPQEGAGYKINGVPASKSGSDESDELESGKSNNSGTSLSCIRSDTERVSVLLGAPWRRGRKRQISHSKQGML